MSEEFRDRFRAAYEHCTGTVFWHQPRTPAEVLRSLAEACEELEVGWDQYGARGAVARLEDELTELFGTGGAAPATRAPRGTAKKARKTLGKVPPKYRDPSNPDNTWTGRGKQPRWLAAYTGNGRTVDEFLIK